ncbi:hypothetical protein FO519_007537 [Halicephalobus sp. NKZ332]|nr:hypothetical protein FO519_007537 [Halicephalobus sp. NKZ332]
MSVEISDSDKLLIEELRSKISSELKLVPAYDNDLSLLRWLVGWERKVDVIVPKASEALKTVHCMGLDKMDLSNFDAIRDFCDNISKPACYMPITLVGKDKEENVVSLQTMGRLDGHGLLHSTMVSDMNTEKKTGKQHYITVIMDLEGIGLDYIDVIKAISGMLPKLQELYPEVLRKVFIIRAPGFIHLIWSVFSIFLAKRTKERIEFCGSDWKEKLKEVIDESILYEHWGGTKPSDSTYGDIRMGGKIPKELYYDASKDPFASSKDLKKINVPARSAVFVPILVSGENKNRKLQWWWKCDSDVEFGVRLAPTGESKKAEEDSDVLIWPKWWIQTYFVPETRTISIPASGLYKLVFDNSFGKFWSKTVTYQYVITEG